MAEQMDGIIVDNAQQRDAEPERDPMNETEAALYGKHAGDDAGRQRDQAQQHEREGTITRIEEEQDQGGGRRRKPPGFVFNGLLGFYRKDSWTGHDQA